MGYHQLPVKCVSQARILGEEMELDTSGKPRHDDRIIRRDPI